MQRLIPSRRMMVTAMTLFLALISLTATSCYYDYGLSYNDYDVVATAHSPSANFGAYKTFFMPDTIPHLTDETSDLIGRTYDQQILNAIANSFEAVGYRRIDTTSVTGPDFIVTVEAVGSKTYVFYGGGYWGWYPWYPGWGYGWGGYYPYYPPVYGGSYSNGTIIVNMIDPDIARSDSTFGAVWFGAINGLLGDTQAGVQARFNKSINQLFVQSPYLGTTQP